MSGGTGDGRDPEGKSFAARLSDARQRHGLEPKPADPEQSGGGQPASGLGLGMQVAVEMVAALIVAVGIGWALDRWLHTAPIFIALFVLLGGAAGVLNVWRLMGPGRT